MLIQGCTLANGNLTGFRSGIDTVHAHVFSESAALAFYLVRQIHGVMSVVYLPLSRGHFAVILSHNIGFCRHHGGGFDIRRKIKDAAYIHMRIVFFLFPGAGSDVICSQHIGPIRIQRRPFGQNGFGIRCHVVVGFCPVHADDTAGPCPGGSTGGRGLHSTDIGLARHIPCTGQGSRCSSLGIHRHRRRICYRYGSAGIPVRITGGIGFPRCADLQILHIAACCPGSTIVIGRSFRITNADCHKQTHGSIAHGRFTAGIVLGDYREGCARFLIGVLFFLFRFPVRFLPNVHSGCGVGNGIGEVGIYGKA